MATKKDEKRAIYERKQQLLNELTEFEREHGIELNALEDEGEEFVLIPRKNTSPPQRPEKSAENPDGIVDIITFCEHPYYLDLQLTPWQKLILKVFYMGSEGNSHLEPTVDKPETGCNGCVWEYVRKNEEKIAVTKLEKGQFRRIASSLPWENSPCLRCKRFDPDLRAERFDQLLTGVVDKRAKEEREQIRDEEPTDQFNSEMDLLNSSEIQPRVRDQIIRKFHFNFNEMVLVLGRRSGKSFLVSVIALYQAYRFIMMGHPQPRYNLLPYDIITILNVARSEDQAKGAIFEKIWGIVAESPFFYKYIGKKMQNQLHLRTDADIAENERRREMGQEEITGSIQLISGHSNSTTLVGKTVCTLILDEMAEMAGPRGDDGTDRVLYEKLGPSTANFGREGKVICISNPLLEAGKFFELYDASFTDDGILMFQLPTWLSNPTVEKSYIERKRITEPGSFGMQFAAVFQPGGREPFLPREYIEAAVARGIGKTRREIGTAHMPYFMHIDPSHNSDLYTIVIVHAEPDPHRKTPEGFSLMKIVVDHVHFWRPKGKNHPIDSDEVDKYVIGLKSKFAIRQISYDHWMPNTSSVMKLQNQGFNVCIKPFTSRYQDAIYTNLFDLFATDRIDLYTVDTKIADANGREMILGEATETIKQLEHLQKVFRGNKPKIEALVGFNDDVCDCIAAAAFEAMHTVVHQRLPRGRIVNMGRLI